MISNKELSNQYTIFSSNVRYYRRRLHMTQEDLAEKADLSISYIKQIESRGDYTNVTFNTISKLSKALNVTIRELFTEEL